MSELLTLKSQKTACFTMPDRRSQVRIDMVLAIECTIAGRTPSFLMITENISIEGLHFISSTALKKGQKVGMRIFLRKNLLLIIASGLIVWTGKLAAENRIYFHGGIRLTSLNDAERNALRRFIEKHSFGMESESDDP